MAPTRTPALFWLAAPVNWAGGALKVALLGGVGTTAGGAGGAAMGADGAGCGLVSMRRPLVAGLVVTTGVLIEDGVMAGNWFVMVAGGAPVTVTVAVPHSQGSSPDSPDGLLAEPVPLPGGGALMPEARGLPEPVAEGAMTAELTGAPSLLPAPMTSIDSKDPVLSVHLYSVPGL